jgi:hypothetical protein
MKAISKALLEAQKEMGNAIKDSSNPFFKSKYADLNSIREACMPVLNKHGIVVLQPIVHIEGKNFVKTVLLHESGEQLDSLIEIIYSKPNDAQAQGSGITYARRYGLQSFVNVGADDDDGNKASTSAPVKTASDYEWLKKQIKACKSTEDLTKLYNTLNATDKAFLKNDFATKGNEFK